MTRFRRPLPGLIVVALVALGASGCGAPERPSIVLISIDSLRSDRLPAYGYTALATPHIDRLSADSILFERAYSPAPITLPAHATLLTGLLPPDHGVRSNSGYPFEADALPYLPRLLGESGYATGAAVASYTLRGETGLAGGFDLYEDEIELRPEAGQSGLERSGAETLSALLPWLRSVADRPFFLFLHLNEPSSPYAPGEPFASRYESGYEGEIAAADEVVGALLAELDALGLYDDAAILLTADHGEGLGDHGEAAHGVFLYREAIQVPLLVKLPGGGRSGERVSVPAQLADVAPTVLGFAGVASRGDAPGAGRSLLGLGEADAERPIYAETFFPRFHFGWSELVSVIAGRFHYVDSPEPELYDLVDDPTERANLIGEREEATRRLAQLARAYERDLADPEVIEYETWSRAGGLGYLTHARASSEVDRPSPASQASLLRVIRAGLGHAAAGEPAAAANAFAEVVRANPHALVVWEQLGHSFERLGRAEDARRSYLRALELSRGAPHLRLAAARASMRVGNLDEAAAHAGEALAWYEAGARTLLGEIALAAGDLEGAERESRAAVALETPNSSAMFTLAQVQLRRGEYEAALETTDENERQVGRPVPRLDLLRANILASMGRLEESERALRREIERFPGSVAAYPRLALYLARQGRPKEAVDTIKLLLETHPTPQGFLAAARSLETLGDPTSAEALRNEARRRFPGAFDTGS